MKKISLVFGLLAVLLSLAQAGNSLDEFFKKLKAGEKQTVVAYGTSLTADGAWVVLMQKWFEEKYPGLVTVVNSGGRGQHSDWGVAQLEGKVLANKPNLVFLEFSYNDAHQRFQLTPEHCRKNLDGMVEKLQAAGAVVVLQTMNAPWDPPEGKGMKDSLKNRPNLEGYNDNYRNCAKEKNLLLVDNYPEWLEIREKDSARYQGLVPDGSHPGRHASTIITWKNVQALLEKEAK